MPQIPPIHFASRVSRALRERLQVADSSLHTIGRGDPAAIGELTVESTSGDGLERPSLRVSDPAGGGDLLLTHPESERDLPDRASPYLWICGLSTVDQGYQSSWIGPPRARAAEAASALLERVRATVARRGPPNALAIAGSGQAFDGDRAWINEHAFPVDPRVLADALRPLLGFPVIAPLPGDTFQLDGGELAIGRDEALVDLSPPSTWPLRRGAPLARWPARGEPATLRRDLLDGELDDLARGLDRFAAHLYAGPIFRALYSLTANQCGGRAPILSLLLLAGEPGEAFVLEYDPAGCRFRPSDATDPIGIHLVVFECWATDLAEALRGALPISAITDGRSRLYHARPELFPCDVAGALRTWLHPMGPRR